MDIFSLNKEKTLFSDDAQHLYRSPVRQLLSTADMDKLISFAGGYPDPVTYPIEDLKTIMPAVLEKYGAKALGYGPSEGLKLLREAVAERFNEENDAVKISFSNVLVTTSSQQGLDICTRLFINPGDVLICSLPSYLGALQSFYSYRADMVGVRASDETFYEDYDKAIQEQIKLGKRVKVIYAIPDFQNPSGITMTLDQRKALVEIARKYDIAIMEDSPYRNIRYDGEPVPMLYELAPERVLHLNSLSKTFAPGFRLGWIIANEDVVGRLMVMKQSTDLCSPMFDQYVAYEYMMSGKFDENLVNTVALYKKKKDFLVSTLDKCFKEINTPVQRVSWTNPEGGLFLFVTLPEDMDSSELFKETLKRNVAFVAGEYFHCDRSGKNTMRMNFSNMDIEKISEGVKVLAEVVQEKLDGKF